LAFILGLQQRGFPCGTFRWDLKINILDSKKEHEWIYYGRMMALLHTPRAQKISRPNKNAHKREGLGPFKG
jgi:hypothetical protein